ncbi:MAG: AmmeMemoRadiSam system radical SAM enzyme [Treponema sp.]|jgi:pyruvate formate lyase activating enzyme|nr:AmmeMemoRadiSam system radical SAM enzyme [Treponema sp.]
MNPVPLFFSQAEDGIIRCALCPRNCSVSGGNTGVCRVRANKNGKPLLPYYGFITAFALDPIEKKPLYHFRPGSEIFSLGFAGCNLRCPFCQNWHISQNVDAEGCRMEPKEIITAIRRGLLRQAAALDADPSVSGVEPGAQIAYTYSEPLVHAEFLIDCMGLAGEQGIANVLVTNGCVNAGAAGEILALTDAVNVDLKCFSEETYSKVLGGDLETVLGFIKLACKMGIHVELTTLVVPGLNDGEGELDSIADFIAGLSGEKAPGEKAPDTLPGNSGLSEIPWHLSAYHPDYRWKAPPTDPGLLLAAARRAREKLRYVYTGNIGGETNDTFCPHCGSVLVSRYGYRVNVKGLSLREESGVYRYHCAKCGKPAPIRY